MRSVLLGAAFSVLVAGPALAQCVYVTCSTGSGSGMSSSSSNSSSSTTWSSATDSGSSQTVQVTPGATEVFVREEIVHQADAHDRHHSTHSQHLQHEYRHGYRDGYRDGYADRGKSKGRTTKARARSSATATSHRRTSTKAKRTQSTSSRSSAWVAERPTYVDPIKDRASSYNAATYGSAVSFSANAQESSSSSWSSSSSMREWSSQGGISSWPAPAVPMQQGGVLCGWSVQTFTTPDGRTMPPQQTWVCQCPQGWRPPGY